MTDRNTAPGRGTAPAADTASLHTIAPAAILLAGGRASRMGGVDKPRLAVGGASLLQHAVRAALMVQAAPLVIVGPRAQAAVGGERLAADDLPADVVWAREDPPFGGPAAGVVAGLAALAARTSSDTDSGILPARTPTWTLVLACDLPHAGAAVRRLAANLDGPASDGDGVCLADTPGRPQWLTGIYRTRALQQSAALLPDGGKDASVRALLAGLHVHVVEAPADEADDIDTWEDFRRFTKEAS